MHYGYHLLIIEYLISDMIKDYCLRASRRDVRRTGITLPVFLCSHPEGFGLPIPSRAVFRSRAFRGDSSSWKGIIMTRQAASSFSSSYIQHSVQLRHSGDSHIGHLWILFYGWMEVYTVTMGGFMAATPAVEGKITTHPLMIYTLQKKRKKFPVEGHTVYSLSLGNPCNRWMHVTSI